MHQFSQVQFRQSLLRRTSGKRITAHDGSRFLNHHRTFSQRKPFLTGERTATSSKIFTIHSN